MWRELDIHIGNSEEWEPFGDRNRRFLERYAALLDALKRVVVRNFTPRDRMDEFVFFSGRLAAEDFWEIFILCGNSEGVGAEKLLRSMFERVVILKYIRQTPEELDAFLDWYWVQKRRIYRRTSEDLEPGLLDGESAAALEVEYARVKGRFERHCDKCGKSQGLISWSKIDMVSMARKVGLQEFVIAAYDQPLMHAHPSPMGMSDRIERHDDGSIGVRDRVDREKSDRVLSTAHWLMLEAVDAQIEHFGLSAGDFKFLETDYAYIWDGAGAH